MNTIFDYWFVFRVGIRYDEIADSSVCLRSYQVRFVVHFAGTFGWDSRFLYVHRVVLCLGACDVFLLQCMVVFAHVFVLMFVLFCGFS